ncbi:MAG: serine/threonine-protein kinase, partial [Chromatiales bacterium]
IIAGLNHRNIITIHDVGVAAERPYLSMEYLEGGDLEHRIQAGIGADTALDLLASLGECLDFVHQRGIVHRDIKPANILFHTDGTVKLTDFGIAKQLDFDTKLTLDGSALGSPYYLSPEQAEVRPLDGRADIYSLGIMFYEMLVGRKPYEADSYIQTILAHLTEPVPTLPREMRRYQSLLDRMIAKHPDDRFDTAAEMVEAVNDLRSRSRPIRGRTGQRPGSPLGERQNAPRPEDVAGAAAETARGRRVLWVAAGTGALLVALAVALWPRVPGDTSPKDTAQGGGASGPGAQALAETAPPAEAGAGAPPGGDGLPPAGASAGPAEVWEDLGVPPLPEGVFPTAASVDSIPRGQASDSFEQDVDGDGETGAGERAADRGVSEAPRGESASRDATAAEDAAQAPVASASAEPPAKLSRTERLLASARDALAADRLTTPERRSAYRYYSEVLALSPNHPKALKGMELIAERYADLIDKAVVDLDYEKAGRYLDRGLAVQPHNERLLTLEQELRPLEEPSTGFIEKLKSFFR